MIVRRGFVLALVGTGVGLGISAAMTGMLRKMLFGVGPFDPLTFAATTGLLLLVCIAASGIPAYRAARFDPMKTLREQ